MENAVNFATTLFDGGNGGGMFNNDTIAFIVGGDMIINVLVMRRMFLFGWKIHMTINKIK